MCSIKLNAEESTNKLNMYFLEILKLIAFESFDGTFIKRDLNCTRIRRRGIQAISSNYKEKITEYIPLQGKMAKILFLFNAFTPLNQGID